MHSWSTIDALTQGQARRFPGVFPDPAIKMIGLFVQLAERGVKVEEEVNCYRNYFTRA